MSQLSFTYAQSGDFGHCCIEYGKDQLDLVKRLVLNVTSVLDPNYIISFEEMGGFLDGSKQIYPSGHHFALYLYISPRILIISTHQGSSQESRDRLLEAVGRFCRQVEAARIFA